MIVKEKSLSNHEEKQKKKKFIFEEILKIKLEDLPIECNAYVSDLLNCYWGALRLVKKMLDKTRIEKYRVVVVFSPTQSGKTTAVQTYATARLVIDMYERHLRGEPLYDHTDPVNITYTNSINFDGLYQNACASFARNVNLQVIRSPRIRDCNYDRIHTLFFDELHYAASDDAVYIKQLIEVLNNKQHLTAILVSATPLTAFLSLFHAYQDELGLVMHDRADLRGYTGLNEYAKRRQLINIGSSRTSMLTSTKTREAWTHFDQFDQGVMLVRAQPKQLSQLYMMLRGRFPDAVLMINSSNTAGVNDLIKNGHSVEHLSLATIRQRYEHMDLDMHRVIILTVAQLRAGDDLGQKLKNDLRVVWESSKANVSSVVQGLAGRATGYITNEKVRIFMHKEHFRVHIDSQNALESLCEQQATLIETIERLSHRLDGTRYDNASCIASYQDNVGTAVGEMQDSTSTENNTITSSDIAEVVVFAGYTDPQTITDDLNMIRLVDMVRTQLRSKIARLHPRALPFAKASWSKYHKFECNSPKSRARSSGLYDRDYIDAVAEKTLFERSFVKVADISKKDHGKTEYHAMVFSQHLFSTSGESLTEDQMSYICERLELKPCEEVVIVIRRTKFDKPLVTSSHQPGLTKTKDEFPPLVKPPLQVVNAYSSVRLQQGS